MEFALNPILAGNIPNFVSRFLMADQLNWLAFVQAHFLKRRLLKEFDEEDGEALGEALFVEISDMEKTAAAAVDQVPADLFQCDRDVVGIEFQKILFVCNNYAAMAEFAKEKEWFVPMMAHVLMNRLRPGEECEARSEAMNLVQGRIVGRGFASFLATNMSVEAAVDEWILRYQCLKELDEYSWFRPMMEVVGTRLLSQVAWGVKSRVFLGLPTKGIENILISCLMRVVVKVCTDFTGILHFRLPYEMGGAYWSISMLMSHVMVFLCVYLYTTRVNAKGLGAPYLTGETGEGG